MLPRTVELGGGGATVDASAWASSFACRWPNIVTLPGSIFVTADNSSSSHFVLAAGWEPVQGWAYSELQLRMWDRSMTDVDRD